MSKINALKLKSALAKYGEQIKTDPDHAIELLTENGYSQDDAEQIIAKANESEETETPVEKSLHGTYEKWTVEPIKEFDKKGREEWVMDEDDNFTFEKVKYLRDVSNSESVIAILNEQSHNTKERYYLKK